MPVEYDLAKWEQVGIVRGAVQLCFLSRIAASICAVVYRKGSEKMRHPTPRSKELATREKPSTDFSSGQMEKKQKTELRGQHFSGLWLYFLQL